MIVIPVKSLSNAKKRLSAALEQEERSALATAMLKDVLEAVASWARRPEVAVVTGDAEARWLARQCGFEILDDPEETGESEAVERATLALAARGAESLLVIPGDIPLVQMSELEAIYAAAPPAGTVLASSRDGRGTNAVLRKPASLFPLRFGSDSFVPHRAAATATGLPVVVLSLPGIALDVDTPQD
ncbi:MAG: 2-phospho-L-lactate guanylyltransferase, partial [Terriglobales bacterium]